MPLATEDWANSTRQRWTWTNWTQNDPNLTSIQNPRTTESKVGDATNTKRTTIDYLLQPLTTVSVYGLVSEVKVYDTNQTTILKRATTEYNLSTAYTSRRIIGLPSMSQLYEQNGFLMSKVTYNYDEGDFTQETNQNISPIQHDNTYFGTSFINGRGNQTSQTRWNVNFENSANEAVTTKVIYDTAGSVVAQLDTLNRKVKISYTDSFNDTQNRNSFAYPTTLTDPANNSSIIKCRYDIGANVWAKSPAPQNQTSGKESTRTFDTIGRLERQMIVNNGAYTRYEYPSNQINSKVYSTIIDTNNNGADGNDEVLTEALTDGAGRVRQSRTELPNSLGGWSGTKTEYDLLGRVTRSTVPTEIDKNWNPSGDDNRGVDGTNNPIWLWATNEYDWKWRVTRTINTDGTDTLASYDGCGWASGQITTVQGELVPRDDQPTVNARRTQKAYADILGRTYKTEVLNWDNSVYTAAVTQFNGRDQALNIKQYQGGVGSSTFQETLLAYDGHGRLQSEHRPEQEANKATLYNYNRDDNISAVTDARGASTNYVYNNRGLVEQMSYAAPNGLNITIPATVSFSYDALGNRTQMTDGLGTQTYQYDQLSRLTSETRSFTNFNSYSLNYSYGLAGQLTSLSDPTDASRTVSYEFDKTGRLTTVGGGGFGGVTQYLTNIGYRAFGSVKAANYGSGKSLSLSYDNRLQIAQYAVSGTAQTSYQYYADGQTKFVADELDNRFDRLYRYDQMGRIKQAKSGVEARDEQATSADRPFRQSYGYRTCLQLND